MIRTGASSLQQPSHGRPAPGLSRRGVLLGLTTAVAIGRSALALAAAPTERRLVVINLRGALDGMAAVVPYGDPHLAGLRENLLPPPPGSDGGVKDLGGFFGLHPALTNLHGLFAAGEVLVIHAVAGPYRERSHFLAQDYLESGADKRMTSGWLNRVLAALPKPPNEPPGKSALAVGVSMPLLLRGPITAGNWAPTGFSAPRGDMYAAIAALHRGDPITGPAIEAGLRERGFTSAVLAGKQPANDRNAFPALASAAGEMLRAPDGPRLAAMEIGGWDTHAGQNTRLEAPLRQLDSGLANLKAALGPVWRQTAILVMTEFGRTARSNGTGGTDHGTATVAFVAGGAVAGGRVLADWPGLGPGRLFEDRDLAPTTDLRALAKGLLVEHLKLSRAAATGVFPASDAASPMHGLIRA